MGSTATITVASSVREKGTNPPGSCIISSTNSSKQHSHHHSSYKTLREDQSILQGTPGSWPGKAQSHPSANSLCSVFNFNLSGTTGQLLKIDSFDMYSGGKHSHSAAWWFPARAHTSTAGCWLLQLLPCHDFIIKSSGLGPDLPAWEVKAHLPVRPGVLTMLLHLRLASCSFYKHVIAWKTLFH